jgi:glycosyltransferase involved in cell wall biosynthesis
MTKKGKGKNKEKIEKYPFVSICTPTFNRRPFIPVIIKCFESQDYPKDKIEWLILDDGTDKIEDLVCNIPQVKYFKYDEKLTLGKKRNILNDKSLGDIIIYMDDDDYYPPERISHAVNKLQKSKALCAGSSEMFIYFKHINKMYKFGPYGPNHATAGTFAFKKELLKITRFDEDACIAEEKKFLKDYTIPFVQLEPKKAILVFSHIHNSFDKKELLKQMPNPFIHESDVKPDEIVKDKEILDFFMEKIEKILIEYKPGAIENKPDVLIQLEQIKQQREKMINDSIQKQNDLQNIINNLSGLNSSTLNQNTLIQKFNEQQYVIQHLIQENTNLKHNLIFLENKLKEIINIQEMTNQKIINPEISNKNLVNLPIKYSN